jgi:hypothetical protein
MPVSAPIKGLDQTGTMALETDMQRREFITLIGDARTFCGFRCTALAPA